jgi:hypothetical protein
MLCSGHRFCRPAAQTSTGKAVRHGNASCADPRPPLRLRLV